MDRAYFSSLVDEFLDTPAEQVLGRLTAASEFAVDLTQRDAWLKEIQLLAAILIGYRGRGRVYLEFVVPRLGKRIDAVLVLDHTIFVVEFKVGATAFGRHDIDQVWDYALDLKNFHESSHAERVAPVLVVTGAVNKKLSVAMSGHSDGVVPPTLVSADRLAEVIGELLAEVVHCSIDARDWERGRYRPTPTIIEAASALYRGHAVSDISRNDAGAINITKTSAAVSRVIEESQRRSLKSICLVTGVPGAGKTLVGLDVAARHQDPDSRLHSVYLSGNGPLVAILREALARDDVERAQARGTDRSKSSARQAVKTFCAAPKFSSTRL